VGLGQREQGVKRRRPRLARFYIRYICRAPESVPWLPCRDPESVPWLPCRGQEAVPGLPCRGQEAVPGLLVVASHGQFGAGFPAAAPFDGGRWGNGLPGRAHGTYRQMM
jgi:hypothetical protein